MTRVLRALWLVLLVFPALAVAQDASRTAVLYRDSYVLEARGDYAGALTKVRAAVTLHGVTYFSTMRAAWLSYLAGDIAAAIAGYTAAVAAAPAAVEPRLGLTLPLLASRNWPALERAAREVLALDPRDAVARGRLAQAQYESAKFADAAAGYEKLAADYPSNLDYKTGLGWSLQRMGRVAEARRLFEEVLAVSPDNVNALAGVGR